MKILNEIRAGLAVILGALALLLILIASVIPMILLWVSKQLLPGEDKEVITNALKKFTDSLEVKVSELEAKNSVK